MLIGSKFLPDKLEDAFEEMIDDDDAFLDGWFAVRKIKGRHKPKDKGPKNCRPKIIDFHSEGLTYSGHEQVKPSLLLQFCKKKTVKHYLPILLQFFLKLADYAN